MITARPEEVERFIQALSAANALPSDGIGRLNEGSLHRTLKLYFEPDTSRHEIKIGRYVADIVNGDGIIEIQTRAFQNMRSKLEDFLSIGRVTIVFPIAVKKDVVWLDPETGELSKPNKSPKKETVFDVFPELYKLKEYLCDPRLTVKIMFMSMTDMRMLCGWDKTRKRGSHREDRIPREIFGSLPLASLYDYESLLPETLPDEFSAKEFSAHARIKQKVSGYVLRLLREIGVIKIKGTKGKAYIYEKNRL